MVVTQLSPITVQVKGERAEKKVSWELSEQSQTHFSVTLKINYKN